MVGLKAENFQNTLYIPNVPSMRTLFPSLWKGAEGFGLAGIVRLSLGVTRLSLLSAGIASEKNE